MFDHLKSALSLRIGEFVRQRGATTTVEFGLVAAPFIALTIGIMQTALVFFSGQTLETAAAAAGRLIMTGQAQTQGWGASQFKTQVCGKVLALINCQSGLSVDVETYSSFAQANLSLPITSGNFNTSGMGYNPGGPGSIVVVRLYYQFPAYVNLMGFNMGNLSSGADLIAATAVFKNEPYASS